MHEGCISRASHAECSLGRHRRLILPPIAVLKDQPRRKREKLGDGKEKCFFVSQTVPATKKSISVYILPSVRKGCCLGGSSLTPPLLLQFYPLGGLIRDAVSKVRSVLPGNRDEDCEPPLCVDPDDPEAVAAAAAAGGFADDDSGAAGGGGEQGTSFVEAVREAAAALDVAGAKEVGSRLAGKVGDTGRGRGTRWRIDYNNRI